MKMKNILNQPYPVCISKAKSWRTVILISSFVTAFMLIFQPFGLSGLPEQSRVLILVGYGLVTFVVLFINLIIIERYLNEDRWKVYKELLWTMWIVFSIGVANFFYTTYFISFGASGLNVFLKLELYTFAIGIFPVSAMIFIMYYRYLSENNRAASEINQLFSKSRQAQKHPKSLITIHTSAKDEKIRIDPDHLRYIESRGNYIYMVYLNDKTIQKDIVRATLSSVREAFSGQNFIIQCHRSFIVNKKAVIKVSGNAQGLKLQLDMVDEELPVSRSFINMFRS